MPPISSGIDRVRVFEVPNGIWSGGGYIAATRTALVRWRSSWSDKFYQIYVNGRYAGTTVDSQQRQMIVQVPTSLMTGVRIEVFAVEAKEAGSHFSDEVDSDQVQSGRVRIDSLRSQNLPIGSTAQVYFDNGTGEIDYDNPLTDRPIGIWPVWQDKAGFGISRFGASDFGYDSAAAVGFGKGSFGHGQFGLDADVFEWLSGPVSTGVYKFAVKVIDQNGNENSSETAQVTVTLAARPAEQVSISSFDKQTNQLVLSVS
jgi:hypothetical protein